MGESWLEVMVEKAVGYQHQRMCDGRGRVLRQVGGRRPVGATPKAWSKPCRFGCDGGSVVRDVFDLRPCRATWLAVDTCGAHSVDFHEASIAENAGHIRTPVRLSEYVHKRLPTTQQCLRRDVLRDPNLLSDTPTRIGVERWGEASVAGSGNPAVVVGPL